MNENPLAKKKSKKKVFIIVSCTVILTVIVAGILGIRFGIQTKAYEASIEKGNKYLQEEKYAEAIVQFTEAIEIEPKKEDAYISLVEIYILQERYDTAKNTIQIGLEMTESRELRWLLATVNDALGESQKEKEQTQNDLSGRERKDIEWDTAFFQKIQEFTFSKFEKEYGFVKSSTQEGKGGLEVVHSGLQATFFYQNTSDNQDIVDISRKKPKPEGMPTKIELKNLGYLFRNFTGKVSLQEIQMLIGKKIVPKKTANRSYITIDFDGCILKIETDKHGNIVSKNAWNEIELVNANKSKQDSGHLSGVIIDSVTGQGVDGARAVFEPQQSGIDEVSIMSESDGVIEANLEEGKYEVTITAEGYIEESFSISVEKGESYSGVQFTLSPELEGGSARIVLEWNDQPKDLDSYLIGTTDRGTDFTLYYGNTTVSENGKEIANLDLDDVDGYGPETTTINNLNGVYKFVVSDFLKTGTMRQLGATVKVYLPGSSPMVIDISSAGNDIENTWEVFELDHGKLTVIGGEGDDEIDMEQYKE